jgi:hypothetical protein
MKTNPKKRPATEADVRRAKAQAVNDAVRMTSAIFLTVLCDKFGGADYIPDIWNAVNKLSEEIKEKRVSVPDLIRTLNDEYDILV